MIISKIQEMSFISRNLHRPKEIQISCKGNRMCSLYRQLSYKTQCLRAKMTSIIKDQYLAEANHHKRIGLMQIYKI